MGTFVVLDFYADWCGPCKIMDSKVWTKDTIQSLQRRFVNVRIDATSSTTSLAKYSLKGIPALIILDAHGNEYFRRIGTMSKTEIISLLNSFPPSMEAPYAADLVVSENPEAFNSHFLRARYYQEAARTASGSIAAKLAKSSSESLDDAQKDLAKKGNTPANLLEHLSLMEAENFLLRGRAKKALKAIAALGDELDVSNEAHACYIKGMAYRKTNRPELAEECYDQMLEAEKNEEFLALYKER